MRGYDFALSFLPGRTDLNAPRSSRTAGESWKVQSTTMRILPRLLSRVNKIIHKNGRLATCSYLLHETGFRPFSFVLNSTETAAGVTCTNGPSVCLTAIKQTAGVNGNVFKPHTAGSASLGALLSPHCRNTHRVLGCPRRFPRGRIHVSSDGITIKTLTVYN